MTRRLEGRQTGLLTEGGGEVVVIPRGAPCHAESGGLLGGQATATALGRLGEGPLHLQSGLTAGRGRGGIRPSGRSIARAACLEETEGRIETTFGRRLESRSSSTANCGGRGPA